MMKRNSSRWPVFAMLALLAVSLSSCAALAQPPLSNTPMPSPTTGVAESLPQATATALPTSTPVPTAVQAVSATVVAAAAATAVPEATAVPAELPVTGASAELNALLGLLPLVALLLLAVPAVVGWRSGQK